MLVPAVKKSDTDLKLHIFNNCFEDDYSQGIIDISDRTFELPTVHLEGENISFNVNSIQTMWVLTNILLMNIMHTGYIPLTGKIFYAELVWKVARSTSAAPYHFTEFEGYIDGGMLANNPSVEALTKIQDYFRKNGQKLPISLILSVGSGINPPEDLPKIDVHKNPANPRSWKKFIKVMTSAVCSSGDLVKNKK